MIKPKEFRTNDCKLQLSLWLRFSQFIGYHSAQDHVTVSQMTLAAAHGMMAIWIFDPVRDNRISLNVKQFNRDDEKKKVKNVKGPIDLTFSE